MCVWVCPGDLGVRVEGGRGSGTPTPGPEGGACSSAPLHPGRSQERGAGSGRRGAWHGPEQPGVEVGEPRLQRTRPSGQGEPRRGVRGGGPNPGPEQQPTSGGGNGPEWAGTPSRK